MQLECHDGREESISKRIVVVDKKLLQRRHMGTPERLQDNNKWAPGRFSSPELSGAREVVIVFWALELRQPMKPDPSWRASSPVTAAGSLKAEILHLSPPQHVLLRNTAARSLEQIYTTEHVLT